MCSISPPVSHVIFDFDGTLVNTESLKSRVFKTFSRNIGKEAEFTLEIEAKLFGHPLRDRVERFITDIELSINLNECMSEIVKQLNSSYDELSFMPGVQTLVDYFGRNDIPMAIASSNTNDAIKRIIKTIDFKYFDRFQHIVGGDDEQVTHPKPKPDVFLLAAKRFSLIPKSMDEVLVFEDSEIGVEASIAAGMKCVLIPDQRLYITSKENSKATVVLKSMEDFRPELFGL